MKAFEAVKYKGEWALYCFKSECYVLFGTKKEMQQKEKELNIYVEEVENMFKEYNL